MFKIDFCYIFSIFIKIYNISKQFDLIKGKMPSTISTLSSSLCGWFKKSGRNSQKVKLESRVPRSTNDDLEFSEEEMKIPIQKDKIDNQTINSLQTEIKCLRYKMAAMTSIPATIKDLADEIKCVKAEINKKGYSS